MTSWESVDRGVRWGRIIALTPLVVAGGLIFVALGGALVQMLWNWLMPALFGWPALTFWQALGLLALCRILFGGLGAHGGPGARARRRVAERLDHLSPETRERIRERLRQREGAPPEEGSGG